MNSDTHLKLAPSKRLAAFVRALRKKWRPWLQQLGGKSKTKCKATKSWATKSKATKSKATKSKAKSDTSPVTPELVAARLPFKK